MANSTQWQPGPEGSLFFFYEGYWWKFWSVTSTVPCKFFLQEPEGLPIEIPNRGGLYLALDVAAAYITNQSLDDIAKMY